jgi:hypothetical protein
VEYEGQSIFNIALATASLESHGHMALEWLLQLNIHHKDCRKIDPLLCPTHADLSQRFNDQLRWMNDCRRMIALLTPEK